MKTKMQILTNETLDQACKVIDSAFPYEVSGGNAPSEYLRASLDEQKKKELLDSFTGHNVEYYTLIDESTHEVIGVTGLYTLIEDMNEASWGAWTGIHNNYKGKGFGKFMIDSMIEKARNNGKKYVRTYVSDHSNEAVALNMYKRRGFELFKQEPLDFPEAKNMFYYQLKL